MFVREALHSAIIGNKRRDDTWRQRDSKGGKKAGIDVLLGAREGIEVLLEFKNSELEQAVRARHEAVDRERALRLGANALADQISIINERVRQKLHGAASSGQYPGLSLLDEWLAVYKLDSVKRATFTRQLRGIMDALKESKASGSDCLPVIIEQGNVVIFAELTGELGIYPDAGNQTSVGAGSRKGLIFQSTESGLHYFRTEKPERDNLWIDPSRGRIFHTNPLDGIAMIEGTHCLGDENFNEASGACVVDFMMVGELVRRGYVDIDDPQRKGFGRLFGESTEISVGRVERSVNAAWRYTKASEDANLLGDLTPSGWFEASRTAYELFLPPGDVPERLLGSIISNHGEMRLFSRLFEALTIFNTAYPDVLPETEIIKKLKASTITRR